MHCASVQAELTTEYWYSPKRPNSLSASAMSGPPNLPGAALWLAMMCLAPLSRAATVPKMLP